MLRFSPLFVLFLAGCSSSGPEFAPVEGTVKLANGKPAVGCTVEFRSEAGESKGLNAKGEVDAEGRFNLSTIVDGKPKPGAALGKHSVAVFPPEMKPSNMDGPPPIEIVPVRYRKYEESGLSFEAKQGANSYSITIGPQ